MCRGDDRKNGIIDTQAQKLTRASDHMVREGKRERQNEAKNEIKCHTCEE